MKTTLLQGCVFSIPQGTSLQQKKNYCDTWISPYLSLVYNFPDIPFFFYISGSLLETLETSFTACKDVLKELIDRGQVELLGGFYYDCAPLLQVKVDQQNQLEKHSHFIRKNYKYRTNGLWITPGTYDNSVIPILKKSGAKYLFSEQAYLESLSQNSYFGLAEELGETLFVFSYDKKLVYSMFNEKKIVPLVKKIFDDSSNIKSVAVRDRVPVLSQILFAEYHDVPDKKIFFDNMALLQKTIMEKNVTQQCVLPSMQQKKCNNNSSLCRIRTTTYGDEENESFVKQILYKPESRLLYGCLQHYTRKIKQYKKDKIRKKSAQLLLEENQEHYAFWSLNRPWGIHDVKVRQNVYKNFVLIEKSLQKPETSHKARGTQFLHTDIDLDGNKEFMIFLPSFMAIVETHNGSLCMLQRLIRFKVWNYCAGYSTAVEYLENTAAHAPWSFREMLVSVSEDTSKIYNKMVQNKYTPITFSKASFNKELSSLILSQDTTSAAYNVLNGSLVDNPAVHDVLSDGVESNIRATKNTNNGESTLYIEKNYIFKGNVIQTQYRFTNNSLQEKSLQFVIELNISFVNDTQELEIVAHADSKIEKKLFSNKTYTVVTNKLRFLHYPLKEQITLELPEGSSVHITPVYYTLADTNKLFYQQTQIIIVFPITVQAFSYEERAVSLGFSSIKPVSTPPLLQNTTHESNKKS